MVYNFGLLSHADVQIVGGYVQKEEKRTRKGIANLTQKLAGLENKAKIGPGSESIKKAIEEVKEAIQVQTTRLDQALRILDIVTE